VEEKPRKSIAGFVAELLPDRLVDAVLDSAGVERHTIGAYLSQKARNRLVETLKAWPFAEAVQVPIEKGEVTAGGIALSEVDPHTMRSVRIDGLYLCGEVLDIAGPVGGYNLQAAFATGFVAGESVAA
jgi:predicted flavoprotein YhiN